METILNSSFGWNVIRAISVIPGGVTRVRCPDCDHSYFRMGKETGAGAPAVRLCPFPAGITRTTVNPARHCRECGRRRLFGREKLWIAGETSVLGLKNTQSVK